MMPGKVIRHRKRDGNGILVMLQVYGFGEQYVPCQHTAFIIVEDGLVGYGQSCDLRLGTECVVFHALGPEYGDSVDASEQHGTIALPAMGIGVELVTLNAFVNAEIAECPRKRIEAAQAVVGTYPEPAIRILFYSMYHIAWKPVGGGVSCQLVFHLIIAEHPVGGCYPYEFGRAFIYAVDKSRTSDV